MERFYSDLITESFYDKLNRIKNNKIQLGYTIEGDIQDYTFIFVNPNNLKSVLIEEKDLSKEIDDVVDVWNLRIVVLIKFLTKYAGYWNTNYDLIGIFKGHGDISRIDLNSLSIESFSICSSIATGAYNGDLIKSCTLIMLQNPFKKYLNKMIKPVRKAIKSTLPNEVSCDYFDIQEEELKITISAQNALSRMFQVTSEFEDFLNAVKEIDDNFTHDLLDKFGRSKFSPETYE